MPEYKCLKQQTFADGNYSIVPIRMEDRWDIMRWRNEQIYHLRQLRPLTETDQDNYFKNVVSKLFDEEQPGQILVSFLKDGRLIGYGGLVHINWADRHAEVSFIMDTQLEKEQFGQNWSRYLRLLYRLAFDDLGFHKLFTYAFDLRPHLYPVLEQNGFVEEARLKEHCLFEGQYKDVVIHSVFADHRIIFTPFFEMTDEEKKMVWQWRNNDDVRRWMYNRDIIPWEGHLRFIESLRTRDDCRYWLVTKDNDYIGVIDFNNLEDGRTEFGFYRNPDIRGVGFELVKEGLLYAFGATDMQSCFLTVDASNGRAIALDERIGFRFHEEEQRDGHAYKVSEPFTREDAEKLRNRERKE